MFPARLNEMNRSCNFPTLGSVSWKYKMKPMVWEIVAILSAIYSIATNYKSTYMNLEILIHFQQIWGQSMTQPKPKEESNLYHI